MRKPLKIYAAVFAFLLAGFVGVGQARAVAVTNCGTDSNGNIQYGYDGNCDGFNKPDRGTVTQTNTTSGGASQTTTYDASTQTQSQVQQTTNDQSQAQPPAANPPAPAKPAAPSHASHIADSSATKHASLPNAPVPWAYSLLGLLAGGTVALATRNLMP